MTTACGCPVQVLSDLDNLPKPASYTVRKFDGFCLDAAGDWLYGVIRRTGVDQRIVRWPFPALDTHETIHTETDLTRTLLYPCIIGGTLHWLWQTPTGTELRTASGTVATLASFTDGWGYWGLREQGGYAWVAFYTYTSPTNLRTGWKRIALPGGAVTDFEFSDGPDDGATAHLLGFMETAVATDGALWATAYDAHGGTRTALTRLNPASGVFTTTPSTVNCGDQPEPLATGEIRTWDNLPVTDHAILISPDQTFVEDPCMAGSDDLGLRAGAAVAWNADYTTVVHKNASDDRFMHTTCTVLAAVLGWKVGLI